MEEGTNKDIGWLRRERNGKQAKRGEKKPDRRSILYDQKLNKACCSLKNMAVTKDCFPQLLDAIHMWLSDNNFLIIIAVGLTGWLGKASKQSSERINKMVLASLQTETNLREPEWRPTDTSLSSIPMFFITLCFYQTWVKPEDNIKLKQVPPNLYLGTELVASGTKCIILLSNTKIPAIDESNAVWKTGSGVI